MFCESSKVMNVTGLHYFFLYFISGENIGESIELELAQFLNRFHII